MRNNQKMGEVFEHLTFLGPLCLFDKMSKKGQKGPKKPPKWPKKMAKKRQKGPKVANNGHASPCIALHCPASPKVHGQTEACLRGKGVPATPPPSWRGLGEPQILGRNLSDLLALKWASKDSHYIS